MFRQIGRRNNHFGQAYAVVRDEYHFNQIAYALVVVNHGGDIVDGADDFLRHVVGGSGFTGEDEYTRLPFGIGVFQNFVVAVDDVHQVERLAFVLVDTLNLHVEQGLRVDFDAQLFFDVIGQALFVVLLHFGKFGLYFFVVGQLVQLGEVVEVQAPIFFTEVFV